MQNMLYVTEADHNGNDGAAINSKATYMALSSICHCDLLSGTRFAFPDILSSDFKLNYDLCWLRGLFSSIITLKVKKSFMVYDICGILHEEASQKDNTKINSTKNTALYKLQKYCATKADLVKVHTQNMREYFEDSGVIADYIQIPPMIDISKYSCIQNKSNSDDMISVGYSGNSRLWQGLPSLLEAFEILEKESQIRLNLIGPSKEDISVNSKNISILNKCSHDNYVSSILPSFDIFVVPRPSNAVTETTTPIKLIEAMASGIPVIASDVGGINEYVQHQKNGYLVEPENPEALADAILELAENRQLAYKLASNGRKTAEQTFDYKVVGKALHDEFEKRCK